MVFDVMLFICLYLFLYTLFSSWYVIELIEKAIQIIKTAEQPIASVMVAVDP